ncbi:MAG: hypothetical protein J3K34DRAFT_412339, partial [Monoraphidium minutum]
MRGGYADTCGYQTRMRPCGKGRCCRPITHANGRPLTGRAEATARGPPHSVQGRWPCFGSRGRACRGQGAGGGGGRRRRRNGGRRSPQGFAARRCGAGPTAPGPSGQAGALRRCAARGAGVRARGGRPGNTNGDAHPAKGGRGLPARHEPQPRTNHKGGLTYEGRGACAAAHACAHDRGAPLLAVDGARLRALLGERRAVPRCVPRCAMGCGDVRNGRACARAAAGPLF